MIKIKNLLGWACPKLTAEYLPEKNRQLTASINEHPSRCECGRVLFRYRDKRNGECRGCRGRRLLGLKR